VEVVVALKAVLVVTVVALTIALMVVVVVALCAEEISMRAVKTAKRTFLCILMVVPDCELTVSLNAAAAGRPEEWEQM